MSKLRNLLQRRVVFLRTITTFPAFTAMSKILWGLLLLNPFVQTFESSRSYNAMAHFFFWLDVPTNETVWGVILIIIGFSHLYTIIGNYSTGRLVTDHISIFFWVFLGVMFIGSNPSSIGPYFYIFIATFEWFYIRREIDQWYQES